MTQTELLKTMNSNLFATVAQHIKNLHKDEIEKTQNTMKTKKTTEETTQIVHVDINGVVRVNSSKGIVTSNSDVSVPIEGQYMIDSNSVQNLLLVKNVGLVVRRTETKVLPFVGEVPESAVYTSSKKIQELEGVIQKEINKLRDEQGQARAEAKGYQMQSEMINDTQKNMQKRRKQLDVLLWMMIAATVLNVISLIVNFAK